MPLARSIRRSLVPTLALTMALHAPGLARQAGDAEPHLIVPQNPRILTVDHPTRVRATGVELDVTIADQIATTTLDVTLHNPHGSAQEAQLLIPVPEGAAVRALQYDGTGPEPSAKILPRDEARRVYESIVARAKDPALLEFAGLNLVRTSVFPVPPGATQHVRITLEQLLASDGARVDYAFPRSESIAASEVPWAIRVEIRCASPVSAVYSPTHELVVERPAPGHARAHLAPQAATKPGTFRLSYLAEPGNDGLAASIFAYPDPKVGDGSGGYFLLLASPPGELPAGARVLPREVIFVIDRSGSMRGTKLDQAREAALQILEGLKEGEFFNIVDYSDTVEKFSAAPVPRTAESIERARAYLRGLAAVGGTNIHDALVDALSQPHHEGTLPMVLFLTDGLPTVGQTGEVAIRDAARAANRHARRVFTFGVGFDVNSPLLTNLARSSRAVPTFVLPDEDVEVKVGQVFRRLAGPVLAAPKLSVVAAGGSHDHGVRDLLPSELPDLFEGEQIVLLGQYTQDGAITLRITGSYLGAERSFDVALDPRAASTHHAFVPRLWATRKIAFLIDQIRQGAANGGYRTEKDAAAHDARYQELIDEIVRLSTEFGILTEYTAFLAEEQVRVAGGGGAPAVEADLDDIILGLRVTVGEDASQFSAPADATAGQAANAQLRARVDHWAGQTREGRLAINQDINLTAQAEVGCVSPTNDFYLANMERVRVTSCQQVADRTLFRRQDRWVDGRILDQWQQAPERTIAFASDEYFRLCERLARENRQGLLAMGGDVLLLLDNQRVLVEAPPAAAR